VIHSPEIGIYELQVISKRLAIGKQQSYSLVITSNGYVNEISQQMIPINSHDLIFDDATQRCHEENGYLFKFQLEDHMEGMSWENIYFTISKVSQRLFQSDQSNKKSKSKGNEGEVVYIRTFHSNHDHYDAKTNRIEHFSVCLHPGISYVASLKIMEPYEESKSSSFRKDNENQTQQTITMESHLKYIRVSSPDCSLYLSFYWNHIPLQINQHGSCNLCSMKSFSYVDVIMTTNGNGDDDFTWAGHDGYYEIYSHSHSQSDELVAAGTLVVSDKSADRWCLLSERQYLVKLHANQPNEDHISVSISTPRYLPENPEIMEGTSEILLELNGGEQGRFSIHSANEKDFRSFAGLIQYLALLLCMIFIFLCTSRFPTHSHVF
jgi:hypothetical protein